MGKGLAFAKNSKLLRYGIVAVTLLLYLASTWTSHHDRWPQRGDTPVLANLAPETTGGDGGAPAVLNALLSAVCTDRLEEVQRLVIAHEVDVNGFLFHSGTAVETPQQPYYHAKARARASDPEAGVGSGAAYSATALHVAAACGAARVVRWLALEQHADVRARDARDMTPRQVFLAMGQGGQSDSSGEDVSAETHHRSSLELLNVPCEDLFAPDLANDARLRRELQPPCAAFLARVLAGDAAAVTTSKRATAAAVEL